MSQCYSCKLLRLNSTPVELFLCARVWFNPTPPRPPPPPPHLLICSSSSSSLTRSFTPQYSLRPLHQQSNDLFLTFHIFGYWKREKHKRTNPSLKHTSKKPQTGKRGPGPLESVFTCVFCNNPQAITVKMDQKLGTGFLACKVCGQKFASDINVLSAPIDVYTDWLDKCHEINEARQREIPALASRRDTNVNSDRHGSSSPAPPSARKRRDHSDRSDDEEDRQPVVHRDEEDRPRKSSSGKKRKVEKKKSKHTTYSDFSDEEDF